MTTYAYCLACYLFYVPPTENKIGIETEKLDDSISHSFRKGPGGGGGGVGGSKLIFFPFDLSE